VILRRPEPGGFKCGPVAAAPGFGYGSPALRFSSGVAASINEALLFDV
jgi:hypothetical protein